MIWKGVPLGFGADGKPISYDGPTVAVLGPPGSAKTVAFVANQLLDDTSPRSYIVLDPKGELAAITSSFRKSIGDVKVIDPGGVLKNERPELKSDGWNPLDDLEPGTPGYESECAAKGDALIKTGANETQPIFPNSARSALTAGINFEVRMARAEGRPPSLGNVREMLTWDTEQLVELVKEMVALGDPEIIRRMRKFRNDNREIQSIKSNIETDTSWMTPEMLADMSVSHGVDFRGCKLRVTTVYVVIATKELAHKAPYLRLCLSSALRAFYREGGLPVTLLVEEAFVLGHLAELEQACSILRGFSGRVVSVWQSLQQCKKLYPDTWGLFLAGALLSFRPAEIDTARFLVDRSGTEIVPVLGASDPTRQESEMRPSWSQQKRERIPLAKMFAMPPGKALVWLPGDEAPRVSDMKGYFEIPKLRKRASPNPYYKAGGKRRPRKLLRRLVAAGIVALALARPDLTRQVIDQASAAARAVLHQVK